MVVAFSFTALVTWGAGWSLFCRSFIWPGAFTTLAIFYLLQIDFFGNALLVGCLNLAFNTVIYSLLLDLLLKVLRILQRRWKVQR